MSSVTFRAWNGTNSIVRNPKNVCRQLWLLTWRSVWLTCTRYLVITFKSTNPVHRFPTRKLLPFLIISPVQRLVRKERTLSAYQYSDWKRNRALLYTDHSSISVHQPEVLRTAFVIVYNITVTHMQQSVNQHTECSRYLQKLQRLSLSNQVARYRQSRKITPTGWNACPLQGTNIPS